MAADSPRPVSAREVAATLASAPLEEARTLVERYADDPRKQVLHAVEVARRRIAREESERARVEAMYALQAELAEGREVVVGVDEVGRGALAGPLTVAAVCLPADPLVWGLNDSKQLSPQARERVAARVAEVAVAIGICHVEPATIDALGMGACLRHAMATAVRETGLDSELVLIDGNPVGAHPAERCVVKGDAKLACVAAASIVAKVTRDALMSSYDSEHPGYRLAENKGYGSAEHIAAIRELGLSAIHRASFCGNFMETPRLF